jgi:hypothetical protein
MRRYFSRLGDAGSRPEGLAAPIRPLPQCLRHFQLRLAYPVRVRDNGSEPNPSLAGGGIGGNVAYRSYEEPSGPALARTGSRGSGCS